MDTQVVPRATLVGGAPPGAVIMHDGFHEGAVYQQRANGWTLKDSVDTLAKCDEHGRLFTRSYRFTMSFAGACTLNNVPVLVHEFGYMVALTFQPASTAVGVGAANLVSTTALPANLWPGQNYHFSAIVIDDTNFVMGCVQVNTAGVITFHSADANSLTTVFKAAGANGITGTTIMYDRRTI
jgi:hypothetical protein